MLPVRDARVSDHAFIIDAWKRSFEGAAAVRMCDRDHYRAEMTTVIRKLLGKPDVFTLVAYDPEDENHLVGFACMTRDDVGAELHYVYVKKDFRGRGIARALIGSAPITRYTFLSPTARPRKGWRFTPRFTI